MPDSAAARLRHIARSRWGERRYLKVERMEEAGLVEAEATEVRVAAEA